VIHSVYLDDAESSMYNARLVRAEGSQLLRYRWYDDDEPRKEVFVEVRASEACERSERKEARGQPTRSSAPEAGYRGGCERSEREESARPTKKAICGRSGLGAGGGRLREKRVSEGVGGGVSEASATCLSAADVGC
jgi:hypothetical protein